LLPFDTTIDAAATLPPKVSITNQGQWTSKEVLAARNDRTGHSRPNPVGRGRFTPCIRAIFSVSGRFTLFAQALHIRGRAGSYLDAGPVLGEFGTDSGKTMLCLTGNNPVQE
jgi:hypothetical protein